MSVNNFFSFVFFLFSLVFYSHVHADILLEPVVGYSFGSFDVEDKNIDDDFRGPSFGGRVGYQKLGFQVGVDYLKSSLKVSDNSWKTNFEASEWAAFAGYKFPILLRVYLGYILSSVAESRYETLDYKFENGTGTKIGIGFTGLPFININFEIRQGVWGQYNIEDTTIKKDTAFKTYFVGLSLPLTF